MYEKPVLLSGRIVRAVHSDYCFATLLLDHDEVLNFAVEEVSVGHWFEVFPIRAFELPPDYKIAWTELAESFEVISNMQIWREEWQESAEDVRQFMGAGPHSTQYAAALGQAPKSIGNVVKVHAGIAP